MKYKTKKSAITNYLRHLKCVECVLNQYAKGLCKKCWTRDRYWQNPARYIAISKEYNNNHPEQRKQYQVRYYEDNIDTIRENARVASRDNYKKNREAVKETSRLYRLAHKEEKKLYNLRYRVRNKEKILE